MELDIADKILLGAFGMAAVLGAVANKTNFCTMGAVSDWVNMGDTGRMRAWLLAIATALSGVLILEAQQIIDIGTSRIPYRSALFDWSRYLLGGLMFGVGMTLASGCGNKNLIRIGGGNIKSLIVVIVAGSMAWLMNYTDFYGTLFYSWMNPISIDLASHGIDSQEIGNLIGALAGQQDSRQLHLWLGGLLAVGLLVFVFRSADFRHNPAHWAGGLTVGLVVLGGWYLTGGPLGQEWMEAVDFMDEPPLAVGMQSYTFISPMAETGNWLLEPQNTLRITFGVASLLGVISGSFLYALLSGTFRWEWFASRSDFAWHLFGGVLMGIGGVLALGCTIGQGVTGLSTMALGSFMAFVAIVLGSGLTMKVQLYKMVYEQDASLFGAIITGLVDFHLLPESLRKLDAV